MPNHDLEMSRQMFLDQLRSSEPQLMGHARYESYWQAIQMQAHQTEDVGQLDTWVSQLGRDKEMVQQLRDRQRAAAASQMGAYEAVQLLNRLLMLLDDVGTTLKKRLAFLRNTIGLWVILKGMGQKSKPVPITDDDKAKEKDDQAKRVALQKPKTKPKPTKQKAV